MSKFLPSLLHPARSESIHWRWQRYLLSRLLAFGSIPAFIKLSKVFPFPGRISWNVTMVKDDSPWPEPCMGNKLRTRFAPSRNNCKASYKRSSKDSPSWWRCLNSTVFAFIRHPSKLPFGLHKKRPYQPFFSRRLISASIIFNNCFNKFAIFFLTLNFSKSKMFFYSSIFNIFSRSRLYLTRLSSGFFRVRRVQKDALLKQTSFSIYGVYSDKW